MQQIRSVWAGLDLAKRVILVVVALAVFGGVLALSRMAASPSLKLLYAGLESTAAGEIVRVLEQEGVAFQVRGDSILVDAQARDALRLTLAADGLPANGGRGYELLDQLSGFGTTSQMFDAAYWRAKEGELARTIVASPHIALARVHIANSGSNPFIRGSTPTASVTVTPSGMPLNPAQANALRYLVASAVAGLATEDVAIIDANGAVVGAVDAAPTGGSPLDRAETLREKVRRLVEARVGPGNAVVEVSVETVSQTERILETRIDPESRVVLSTEVEERSDNSSGSRGSVTVASNLPDGDAATAPDNRSETSETRERTNYEVSQTQMEIERGPGDIKRLSVAVLVNKAMRIGDDGQPVFEDRTEGELDDLRALVAAAVGFDEARGDEITLRSMEMPQAAIAGSPAPAGWLERLSLDFMSLIQMAVLAIVTLALALFVLRPLLMRQPTPAPLLTAPGQEDTSNRQANEGTPALTGEIDDGEGRFAAHQEDMGLSPPNRADEAPVDRLRQLIGERQEETVEILRGWLEEKPEKV